jgi:hypothetical protein
MHIHVGLPEFVSVASYVVIFGFLWRCLAAYLAQQAEGSTSRSIGQAMAWIF